MRSNKGFTLIELMIVVAIIAIIAAIAIPNLLRARLASNESSAIGALRTLSSAQSSFQSSAGTDVDTDGTGEFAGLAQMSGATPPWVRARSQVTSSRSLLAVLPILTRCSGQPRPTRCLSARAVTVRSTSTRAAFCAAATSVVALQLVFLLLRLRVVTSRRSATNSRHRMQAGLCQLNHRERAGIPHGDAGFFRYPAPWTSVNRMISQQ